MPGRSTVSRLPPEARTQIEEWLKEFLAGRLSLDKVMTRIAGQWSLLAPDEEMPSRSAVHRHAKQFERVVQRIERSRELTELFAEQLGPTVADGRGVQVMVQAVQGLIYDLLGNLEDGTPLEAKSIHDLAKAAHHLAAAQKTEADRALKVEADTLKKAAAAAQAVGREQGWSADLARQVRERILGVGKAKDGG